MEEPRWPNVSLETAHQLGDDPQGVALQGRADRDTLAGSYSEWPTSFRQHVSAPAHGVMPGAIS